jgi:hypothetical protein
MRICASIARTGRAGTTHAAIPKARGGEPMTEQWRPVPGWSGYYEVSNRSQIRSVDRVIIRRDGRKYRAKGRLLRPQPHQRSWVQTVTLARRGDRRQACVHRLVQEAFSDEVNAA